MAQVLERCDGLLASVETFDYKAFTQADTEFHGTIIDAARNPQFSAMYASLHSHIEIMRVYWGRVYERAVQTHQEHIRICEALRQADHDAVKRAVTFHLSGSLAHIQKSLDTEST
jgi:DNA-binding GntR family transcriptional regulator